MWPCKGLDFSWDDWLFAVEACLAPPEADVAAGRVERLWSHDGDALSCLTVRSAFDLFLRSTEWEEGDEIVFSALTVPDMPAIARHHGLTVVPLDIDPVTTRWDVEELEHLIGPRTRAVVLTHLFGARLDMAPSIEVAHRHGLVVVEDCAQAYAGPGWTGHADSDLTLFSFGSVKTATALGGAIVRVRSRELLDRMREILAEDPEQTGGEYLRRVLLYGVLKAASHPQVFGMLVGLLDVAGEDHEEVLHRLTRSVPGNSLIDDLRRRPCSPLLALLERRIGEGDAPVTRRQDAGRVLLEALGDEVAVPTRTMEPHGYWMVPVLTDDPEGLIRALRDDGFDAMSGRLEAVEPTHGQNPIGARSLARRSVYLPFDPEMPSGELVRLGRLVTGYARRTQQESAS